MISERQVHLRRLAYLDRQPVVCFELGRVWTGVILTSNMVSVGSYAQKILFMLAWSRMKVIRVWHPHFAKKSKMFSE